MPSFFINFSQSRVGESETEALHRYRYCSPFRFPSARKHGWHFIYDVYLSVEIYESSWRSRAFRY